MLQMPKKPKISKDAQDLNKIKWKTCTFFKTEQLFWLKYIVYKNYFVPYKNDTKTYKIEIEKC
jgi:hypothetical protein